MILYDEQLEAVDKLHNGSVLCGGVGSGKSLTSLGYYLKEQGVDIRGDDPTPTRAKVQDLYIITTAAKRDKHEWEKELARFAMSTIADKNYYKTKVVIDSWNNIGKYKKVVNSFFIFDEQHATGSGPWATAFITIAKSNSWILLSATPGDKYEDYIPVFIANGFYRNFTEFKRAHCIYAGYHTNYPKVIGYMNTRKLDRLCRRILVPINSKNPATRHYHDRITNYDKMRYREVMKERWDIYKNIPVRQAADLCYVLRRVVNEDISRAIEVLDIVDKAKKAIIFYNFDYELEILRNLNYEPGTEIAEWNGHHHQPIPDGDRWVYLVHYTSGAEGWNCTRTDTVIFYSQNYSYRMVEQAMGRIDRSNTPYRDLHYYHLYSRSDIDMAIHKALKSKKKFNETRFVKGS